MNDSNQHLGDALAYQDYIPVDFQYQATQPAAIRFNGINELNEEILHNILFLEKHNAEAAEDEADIKSAGLASIDFKLNVILDLMLQVFASQLTIPPQQTILLTSTRLSWTCEQLYAIGDMFIIEVYLSRRFPRPLILFGPIDKLEQEEAGQFCYHIHLDGMSGSVQDLLERFIFLKHRRMIASSRRNKNN